MPYVSILVGIMVTADVTQRHRDNIRASLTHSMCKCNINPVFFTGSRGNFTDENRLHHDIAQLAFPETMNGGKTYRWFAFANWLHKTSKFQFDAVFKMDDDTSVDWCGLCNVVGDAIKSGPHFYVGRLNDHNQCGGYGMPLCPPKNCKGFSSRCWVYMSGGMYGMSAASLRKLMNHKYPRTHAIGHEDIQVGLWFKHALPSVNLVNVDNGVLWCHNGAFHKRYPTRNVRHHWFGCDK